MDNLRANVRTQLMRNIRTVNTAPELMVRSFLHKLGFRFRTNVSSLPGSPDIVLARFRTVIFIHGCFWHGHKSCARAKLPKTRLSFWEKKVLANQVRDRRVSSELRRLGWSVLTIWQCEINKPGRLIRRIATLLKLQETHNNAA